jgi:hypothetical protein
MAAFSLYPFCI